MPLLSEAVSNAEGQVAQQSVANENIATPAGSDFSNVAATAQAAYADTVGGKDGGIEQVPPSRPDELPPPVDNLGGASEPSVSGSTTVQDLYPDSEEIGEVVGSESGSIPTPGSADIKDNELVDAELTRLLGEDSPLLAQARADASKYANSRGLMNTSMAAGMSTDAMVRAALPMAQQNSKAYTDAATQAANLNRDAEAQQGELDYRSSQEFANATNQRNTQIIDSVTRLNQQYLQNMGAADIANIEGTYKQLMSTNAAASSIFNSGLSAMAALMDDPKMTPQQVAAGLKNIQTTIEASLRMMSNINNMDFSDVNTEVPGGGGGPPGGGGSGQPLPGTPGDR